MSTQGVRELLQGTLDLLILRTLIFGSQETGIPESLRKGDFRGQILRWDRKFPTCGCLQ